MTSLRTPLKNVRHLGSAKEGADHFWKQRVTALANLLLGVLVLTLIVKLAGADYATVKTTLANPLYGLPILLLGVSASIHMRLGMQVIIEDYIHGEGLKIALVILNIFFSILVGASIVFAILKLNFGG